MNLLCWEGGNLNVPIVPYSAYWQVFHTFGYHLQEGGKHVNRAATLIGKLLSTRSKYDSEEVCRELGRDRISELCGHGS